MSARKFGISIWILAASIAATLILAAHAGLRLNTSPSAPKGFWHVFPIHPDDIERGMLVEVCPPDHPTVIALRDRHHLQPGSCPLGVMPFLKPVAAVAGDQVSILHGQPVRVNGRDQINTVAKPYLPAWPDGDYRVEPDTVWLLSGHSERSFDSRYFGPVPISHVRAKAVPLLIHGEMGGR